MFLGIITLLVALCISAIAAYYSIIGLTAIFAAAFLPIVLMGSVLEVGKIVTAVWLHINWRRAGFLMKSYLTAAVVVLMFITSMGIFGFLSKSHIEQTAMGDEQIAQVQSLNEKIARGEAKITRWSAEIDRLNSGGGVRVDDLSTKETENLDRIYERIDSEKAEARKQAASEVELQNNRITQAAQRKNDNLQAIKQKYIGVFGAEEQKQKEVDAALSAEVSVAASAQREIRAINSRLADALTAIDDKYQPQITDIQGRLASLNTQATDKTDDIDAKIVALEDQIDQETAKLDTVREERLILETSYRALEAEVGPVKYIAEFIYGSTERGILEEAVRWVIVIIVAVFDPLAVCLVLAGVMSISWWADARRERKKKKVAPEATVAHVTDPRLEELEMELQKHNQILDEIEKLLDSNLANVDPAKYAELVAERDRLLAERDELMTAIETIKGENDTLVDKVVATEAERDGYKKQIDDLAGGVEGFQKRIEELLGNIAGLEAEIVRRDEVVLKMAEKYQLVEKDQFGDDLVQDANPNEQPLAFLNPQEPPKKD